MSVYIAIIVILLLIAGLWVTLEGRLLPRKSTRDYWHLSDLPRAKKLEGYIYAARTEWYLKPATWSWLMRHFVSNEKADTYHGKMLTHAGSRSHRGNQFRNWASEILSEYMKKGFVMNDERLKNPKKFIPGCYEHYLVHVMRSHQDFLPELDLVIEVDDQVIGNIMYTKTNSEDIEINTRHI